MRGGSARARLAEEIAEEETTPIPATNASPPATSDQPVSPQAQTVLRKLRVDLEDLLTRLNSDASIKR
jgi:hypothetical protein